MGTPAAAQLLQQWDALGAGLGLAGPRWHREGRRLLRSWSRWPRRYHDLHHLAACLRHAEAHAAALRDPAAVRLALWFHDAVYWPWSRHNESRSAAWAERFLQGAGLAPARIAAVVAHILATARHQPGDDPDTAWVLDIDLAVLGQDRAAYAAFEHGVRSEYRWVRWKTYRAGRSAVLRGFLERPRIYLTDAFHMRCDAAARRNLQEALDALAAGRLFARDL